MSDVVVIGSANVDSITQVARIPRPGETVLATSWKRLSGGKGANQAVASRLAGAPTTFIGAVGMDADAQVVEDQLQAAGVIPALRRVPDSITGRASVIVEDSAENAIVVTPGANATLSAITPIEADLLDGARYILMQLETPVELIASVARLIDPRRTVIALNAAPAVRVPSDALDRIGLLILNEEEANETLAHLGVAPATPFSDEQVARALGGHVPQVVVTLGSRGCVIFDSATSNVERIEAIPVQAVDTTGAGDTFCGALIASLCKGQKLPDAARTATAAAAISVGRLGAANSMPTGEETHALLRSVARSRPTRASRFLRGLRA